MVTSISISIGLFRLILACIVNFKHRAIELKTVVVSDRFLEHALVSEPYKGVFASVVVVIDFLTKLIKEPSQLSLRDI